MLSDQVIFAKLPQAPSKDYELLRTEGIRQIQELASETWTDHNTHDPGITMLEALAYAITDVGNRVDQPIENILSSGPALADQFPDPASVMSVRPWTVDDMRKQLIDLVQVRNAWIQPVENAAPTFYFNPPPANPSFPPLAPFHQLMSPGELVQIKGLNEVLLEFETPGDLQEESMYVDINASVIRLENVAISYADTEGVIQNESLIVECSFPYWDEERVAAWQQPLANIVLSDPDGAPNLALRPLPATLSGNDYLLRVAVAYDGGGPDEISVLIKISNPLEASGPQRDAAEIAILQQLEDVALWQRYNRMVQAAHEALFSAQNTCNSNRNLGEDIYRYRAVRIQEIAIDAQIEMVSGTVAEEVLGTVFWEISQFLDRPPVFRPFSQAYDEGVSGEQMLEGPRMESGWLDQDRLQLNDQHQSRSALYVSDFGAILLQPIGLDPTDRIQAIRGLSLANFVRNRLVTSQARDCLRLINPGVFQPRFSITKSNITVYRDGQRVEVDMAAVVDIVENYRLESEIQTQFGFAEIPLPQGNEVDLKGYLPVGEDLPLVYGLGQAGLSANADAKRHAQRNQLQAYLLPFEQIIANSLAQLGNIPAVFSPEAGDIPTYFNQNLYHIPSTQNILAGAETDWEAFQNDPDNPYQQALNAAGESEAVQLERRHKMLDHLLARQGENMLAYSLQAINIATQGLTGEEAQRAKETVRVRLRDEKAAFLAALPKLQAMRGLGFDCGFTNRLDVISVANPTEPLVPQGWELRNAFDRLLLRQEGEAPNAEAARLHAVNMLPFASERSYYHISPSGARFRYELTDSIIPGDGTVLGETVRTFPNQAAAETEINEVVNLLRGAWNTKNRSGASHKLQYVLGLKSIQRRTLSAPFENYLRVRSGGSGFRYEVLDEGGRVLFFCPSFFPDTETMLEHVHSMVEIAQYERAYRAVPDGNRFRFNLVDADENIMVQRTAADLTEENCLAWGPLLRDHAYHAYSREGFHIVEHILLRPSDSLSSEFLSLYDEDLNPVQDPYTSRVTVVFPSGYTREYDDPEAEPVADIAPARFRNAEFRRYAAQMVKQSLPAHIFPHIIWLDRDSSPVPNPGTASLNAFEMAWRGYLETHMTFGADVSAMAASRDQMNRTLSSILEPAFITALINTDS
ncbi:MAG: hypothetical protein AB8F95_03970 [Bacteroidia bacterium]